MKYSTTKMPPAKMNSSADKTPAKLSKLRKSQRKAEGVCQVSFMKLRSGLIIEKACYFREKNTKRMSPKTGDKRKKLPLLFSAYQQLPMKQNQILQRSDVVTRHALDFITKGQEISSTQETSPVSGDYALSTFNDRFITFAFEDGTYTIYVEHLGKDEEKDKVLLCYYVSKSPAGEPGDEVDGKKLMVKLSLTKDKNFCLQANNQNLSLEIREWPEDKKPLPDQAFFLLHQPSADCVSFECKSNPGTFIGVCDNHLKLIPQGQLNEKYSKKIMFKLCKI
ncbi:interleukin-33 isoform X2 [Loxodonta africana]|nr:interleukin-33 [Elephas maximus indicus]XP_049752743.1 interleukin-33 [Elephas maximus indicus]XP_049752744.1 interleukin-33 [Elephas maximus indicus]